MPNNVNYYGNHNYRLMSEEDQLRREHLSNGGGGGDLGDKEMMILMQQKKIASLDEANGRLMEELNRLGEKLTSSSNSVSSTPIRRGQSNTTALDHSSTPAASASSSVMPKTVDELIDSLHLTPI